jgi:hypothetical protein
MSTQHENYVNSTHLLMKTHLSAMVPFLIWELKAQGGPTEQDYERVRDYATIFGAQGDQLLFQSKTRGQTADLMNKLVEAMAVMAFVPGGVKAFGLYFNASGIPAQPGAAPEEEGHPRLADCMDIPLPDPDEAQ